MDLLNPADKSVITSSASPSPLPISDIAPAVVGLVSDPDLQGTTGTISLNLTGFNASGSGAWTVTLLPAFGTNFSDAAAAAGVAVAFGGTRAPCYNLVATADDSTNSTLVNCTVKGAPSGDYFVSLTAEPNIEVLWTNASGGSAITSRLSITSVGPARGSIGGGTLLTINGACVETG